MVARAPSCCCCWHVHVRWCPDKSNFFIHKNNNSMTSSSIQIQDRLDSWHPFDPSAFDGSQLRYPPSHIERFPLGSPAALLHARVSSTVRSAFVDLVQDNKVKRYWDCGERDDWFERELMSEVLPCYLEAMDEAERGVNKEADVDYRTPGCARLEFGSSRFHIDLRDMVDAMISTAEFFTPEMPEHDDFAPRDYYHFKKSADRRALVALRERHLAALRALRTECLMPPLKL